MKRTALAAVMLVAAFGPAAADEMPIKGTCTSGADTVTFTGSKMPVEDAMTGDFGLAQIFMSLDDYYKLGLSPLEIAPDSDGFQPVGFGELSAAVKEDRANNLGVIRMSTGNFKIVFEAGPDQPVYGLHDREWRCDVKPNF
jgi:hypothetical protein